MKKFHVGGIDVIAPAWVHRNPEVLSAFLYHLAHDEKKIRNYARRVLDDLADSFDLREAGSTTRGRMGEEE